RQPPGCHAGGIHRPDGRRGWLRLRRVLWRCRMRNGHQGADEGDHPGAAGRGVPVADGAGEMHVVRPAERIRGGMGKGVLTAPEGAAIPDEARAGLLADAGLTREGATLHLGGVPLEEIAARVGTPAYVYNAEAIRERYRLLDAALAALPHRICYAVKANSNLAVLRVLRDLGAGADIVSAGELQRALAAGFDPAAIVFSGVGKTVEELEQAVHAGVGHIHLESAHELDLLAGVLERLERSV